MRAVLVAWVLGGCGRLAFDPSATAADAAYDAGEPGLVVWYRMEDGAEDGTIEDSAGADQPASCEIASTCGTSIIGREGAALHLAPPACYMLPFDDALSMPTEFTVALWLRRDNSTSDMTYVTKRLDAGHNSWAIYTNSSSQLGFESAFSPPTAEWLQVASPPIPVDEWVHVAITWDDTTQTIFRDGVRLVTGTPTDIAFDDREIMIGCDEDEPPPIPFNYVSGAIDDVRIYNRVLADSEILDLARP